MIIVDIEASSLEIPDSYPIQIAWFDINTNEHNSYLITPDFDWDNWNPESELLHGISQEKLEVFGQFIDVVADKLNKDLADRELFCDATYYDNFWLDRLFGSSSRRREVSRLQDIRTRIPPKNLVAFEEEFELLELPHCALEDAKLLGALCKRWM